jgi:hypothetical protein
VKLEPSPMRRIRSRCCALLAHQSAADGAEPHVGSNDFVNIERSGIAP